MRLMVNVMSMRRTKKMNSIVNRTFEDALAEEGPNTGTYEESDNFTFDEYKKLAMRTAAIPEEDKESRLTHAALGLASEAGEVAGLLQKEFQGHERDKNHIKKELGDCLWMIAEACDALDISMTEVAITNIIKLKTRFPEGFSKERSLNRDKDDI